MSNEKTILYVSHVSKFFQTSGTILKKKRYIKAVDDVTFNLREGETLGVVGETGCGKTQLDARVQPEP